LVAVFSSLLVLESGKTGRNLIWQLCLEPADAALASRVAFSEGRVRRASRIGPEPYYDRVRNSSRIGANSIAKTC
jgi:hypothetical protein